MHHTDKEIQADLDHTSNLEESEFSYQGGAAEFQEMQAGIEFAVQITPLKDTKRHKEKMVSRNEGSRQTLTFLLREQNNETSSLMVILVYGPFLGLKIFSSTMRTT